MIARHSSHDNAGGPLGSGGPSSMAGAIRRAAIVVKILVLVSAAASPAFAQTLTDQRLWTGISLQERSGTSSEWRWAADAFLRTRDGVGTVDSGAGRFLVGYDVTDRSSVWAGYTLGSSFPAAGGATIEQRMFQQYLWTGSAAGGSIALRSRVEQRFIEGNDATLWRLRQQVRYSRPLAAGNPLAFVVWEELFVHANDTRRYARGLDQNRAFAGVSRALSSTARIEIGYLNQFSRTRSGNRVNHVLSAGASVVF